MKKRIILPIIFIFAWICAHGQALQNGVYFIESSIDRRYVITMQDGDLRTGTNICIHDNINHPSQKWSVRNNNDGTVTIYSVMDNLFVIDLCASQLARGANIHLWCANGTNAQRWRLTKDGDGYRIHSAYNSDWVIDLNGSFTTNGNNIHLWDTNYSDAQKWYFNKTENYTNYNSSNELHSVPVFNQCLSCHGSRKCSNCNGTGIHQYWVGTSHRSQPCSVCGGSGVCTVCQGQGGFYINEYR